MWLKRFFSFANTYDWILFLSVLLLLSFGLAALYGIATSFDDPNFSNFKKQIVFSVVGISLAFLISMVDYNFFRQYAYYFLLTAVILLTAVLFFGTTLRGTTGWFTFFGIGFQPVEVAKIALIIFLARYFSDNESKEKNIRFIVRSALSMALLFSLTVMQPDFGSALMLFFIWIVSLLVVGIPKRYLFLLLGFLVILFATAWLFFFQDYQKDRIASFFNPTADPYGRGYHVRQAVIAVGSGQVFGRGLASGSQSQLKFVPASQTDFIFAVIAEELGLIGASLVISFFLIFFLRLITLAKRTNDPFAFFIILGILVIFLSHFFINVGMNVGLLPVTGVSLPFVSYGGSFLITSFILLGISESIAKKSR